jgi:hypothetical protein
MLLVPLLLYRWKGKLLRRAKYGGLLARHERCCCDRCPPCPEIAPCLPDVLQVKVTNAQGTFFGTLNRSAACSWRGTVRISNTGPIFCDADMILSCASGPWTLTCNGSTHTELGEARCDPLYIPFDPVSCGGICPTSRVCVYA